MNWRLWVLMPLLAFAAVCLPLASAAPPTETFSGVFWQPDCHTLSRLSDYRKVGAQFVVVQWTQFDSEDYSGQGSSACHLDWVDVQRRTGGLPLIIGLKGLSKPTPESLPQLAQESAALVERLKLLPLNPAPLGYYAPIELNPIWPAAQVRAYLDALPRPLWVSAYAVPGQLGPGFAAWLREAVPKDVHLMIQDGVGASRLAPADIAALVRELQGDFGPGGVSVIVEVFRPFPVGQFRSALPWELDRQLSAYEGLQRVAFDGGHYMGRVWQEFFLLYQWWRGLRFSVSLSQTLSPLSTGGPT